MPRILELEDTCPKMKQQLAEVLNSMDEVVCLPTAHISKESGCFKNGVLLLNGEESIRCADLFSPNWFSGVSAVEVPEDVALKACRNSDARKRTAQKLASVVPSEMQDGSLEVGPELDCTAEGRDRDSWTAGFDTPSACIGLYSAKKSQEPNANCAGMQRATNVYYLICKAGGGRAAATFHSQLKKSLLEGVTLDAALSEGGVPGLVALQRVGSAGSRNRARLLTLAAEAIGYHQMDTIGDNVAAAHSHARMATPSVVVEINTISKRLSSHVDDTERSVLEDTGFAPTNAYGQHAQCDRWQYCAGAVNAQRSVGLITASNVQDGFVMLVRAGDATSKLKNSAFNTMPFCSIRTKSNRQHIMYAADKHKQMHTQCGREEYLRECMYTVHPDHEWIRERFAWKSKKLDPEFYIEPPSLWGTHTATSFLSKWARELSLDSHQAMHLHPEAVALPAVEPAKLRTAARHVLGKGGLSLQA